MVEYKTLYQKHAVRRAEQLTSSVPKLLEEFTFPRNSVMHYIDAGTEFGPDTTHPLLSTFDDKIYMEHIADCDIVRGSARKVTTGLDKLILQYHRRYLRFNKMRNVATAAKNDKNLIVTNFAPIVGAHRYRRTVFSIYDEYYNILNALLSTMDKRDYFDIETNHWIPIDIPETLPDIESLTLNAKEVRRDDLAEYNEMGDVITLELYRFIMTIGLEEDDTKVQSSLFGKLSPEVRKRTNLVWTESGSWSWVNLGDLEEWAQSSQRRDLAKKLLTLFNRLLEERTPVQYEEYVDEDGGIIEYDTVTTQEEMLSKPILDKANAAVEAGRMSGQEYKRMEKLAHRYTSIPAPANEEQTLEEFMRIDQSSLRVNAVKMPEISSVEDKSMLESTLLDMNSRYVKEVMEKDIANFVVSMQRAGFAVLDYKQTKNVDYANRTVEYSVKVQPADGSVSTIKFTIPMPDENGEMMVGGVKYRMALQPADLPIRKVLGDRVSLTSYYGKNFVTRSERTVHDYGAWLAKKITAIAESGTNSAIQDVHYGDYFKKDHVVPRAYSGIGQRMSGFKHKGYLYNFDFSKAEEFDNGSVDRYKKDGLLTIAKHPKEGKYLMDDTSMIYHQTGNGKPIAKAMLEEILAIEGRPPVDMAELGVMGKTIPLGIVLGYHLGLSKLLKKLRIKPRWVARGKRVEHGNDEFIIVFKDETLILPRTESLQALIMSGFNMYRNQIRDFNSHEMDSPESYRRLLTSAGLTAQRYGRELELMEELFIDHITFDILKEMSEPTNMIDLYIRAAELLTKDEHPEEVDPVYMRYRGYERMGGLMYGEMIKAIRQYRRQPGGRERKLAMNPKAVWMAFAKDASKAPVEELNPVVETKQQELVTFSGNGGRSAQSMTASARVYSKNNLGTISEAGVDSGKVGINTYTSSNPKFTDVRGRTAMYDEKEDTSTRILSTSSNLAPFSTRGDGKRRVFIGIQQGSSMGSPGYRPMPITTGMEKVLAHRVTEKYAYVAKFDGKVTAVDEEYLTVVDTTGKEEHVVYIGTHFGVVAGTYIPHRIVCDVKVGHKFKAGDVLAFNNAFFERDIFDPNQVQYKMGFIVNTTFMESADTLEDSSSIHKSLADKMTMETTTLNAVDVAFDSVVGNFVKEGTKLSVNDILCTITDEALGDDGRFDETALKALGNLAAVTPKTSISGTVERIEAVYFGNKEDMSESVRKLVNASDKRLAEKAKRTKNPDLPTSGQVNAPIRVGGKPLAEGQVIFKVYITKRYKSGAGNKGVFSNQLKTVYGSVFTGNCRTLSGIPIHAKFAYQSVANRILLDADIWGTGNMLLLVKSQQIYKTYRGIK